MAMTNNRRKPQREITFATKNSLSEMTRLWLRAGDRYVFVCYAMVVMGFVMTFKWDSLFPDRRDYLILTPLPITLKEFFVAKVISLGGFLLLFVIAINVFSCVLVPYVYVVRNNAWRFFLPGITGTCVSGAECVGVHCFVVRSIARRVDQCNESIDLPAYIAVDSDGLDDGLVTVLLVIPGISGNLRIIAESNARVLDYIPVFWFLGIYEVLNPEGTFIPASHLWAATAIEGISVLACVFVGTYLISYRRYSKKILEGVEADNFGACWHQRALTRIVCAVVCGTRCSERRITSLEKFLDAVANIGCLSRCIAASA